MSVSGVEININLSAILASARNVVKDAKKQGRLDDITVRMVRQEVESIHALKKGTLDAEQYKRELTKVVYNLIEEFDNSETEERGASTTVDHSKALQTKRDSDDKENHPQKSFKKYEENTMLSRKRQQEYKSKEFIDSSDDEDNRAESSRSAQKSSTSVLNKRESGKRSDVSVTGGEAKLDDSTVFEDEKNCVDDKSSNLIPVKRRRSKGKTKKEIQKKSKKEQNSSEKSDSQRKSAKQMSPQEETIKRLKALVVACGVRKQWKREFQGLETTASQIARLKTILHDLGMTGRMSMEQAKAIKAKRDLEQEMKDVLEFAGKHSSTAAKGESEESSGNDESDRDSESEEVSNIRKRRPKLNNVDSLQAFLAGQSDDD